MTKVLTHSFYHCCRFHGGDFALDGVDLIDEVNIVLSLLAEATFEKCPWSIQFFQIDELRVWLRMAGISRIIRKTNNETHLDSF